MVFLVFLSWLFLFILSHNLISDGDQRPVHVHIVDVGEGSRHDQVRYDGHLHPLNTKSRSWCFQSIQQFTIWRALDRGGTSTSSFMTTAPGWSAGRERVATTLLMKSAILMTGTVKVLFMAWLQTFCIMCTSSVNLINYVLIAVYLSVYLYIAFFCRIMKEE